MTQRLLNFLTLAAVISAGCADSTEPAVRVPASASSAKTEAVAGPVVARAGNVVITQADVEAKIAAQSPTAQARYRELKYRREFVENLIQFELLAEAGFELGLDKTPKLRDTIKKLVVQELIRDTFDESKADFPEEQLRAFYDRHLSDYVKPERVRASHIFISAPEDKPAERAAAKKKAAKLLSDLKTNFTRASAKHPEHGKYVPTLFSKLASEHSDDQVTRPRGGDMAFQSHDDLQKTWSKEFADSVFALESPHDLTNVVETRNGFHIALYMSRTNAVNRTFDDPDVQKAIKGRLFRDEKQKSFDAYVKDLHSRANVTIDEQVLEAVAVPASPGQAPSPKPSVAQ